jgi:uncharacterized protein (TIGR02246 family)
MAQPGKEVAPGTGKRAQDFIAAFDKGDARALASFWSADGSLVDLTGKEFKGRAAIEKHFEAAFAGRKGAKLHIHISSTRLVTPDVALEDGTTEVISAAGPPNVAQFSAVLVKKNGEWYFESVRESPAQAPTHSRYFEDLEWLAGQWTGETDKGESTTVSYEFAENGNFMVCSFATMIKGVPVAGGTQWIAWDPIDKQLRSWSFYSGGGFGEATWTKDGNKWVVDTRAKSADGKKISVTNVVTKVDADNATWQATKLSVDGKAGPDGSVTKLKRSTMK